MMDPSLEIELGDNGGLFSLASLDKVSEWLEIERTHWAWLASAGAHMEAHERYSGCFQTLTTTINNIRNGSHQIGQLQAELANFYLSRKPILHSNGKLTRIIDELRPEIGDQGSAAAIRFVSTENNLSQIVTSISDFQAIFSIALPDMANSVTLTNRLQTARDSERRSMRALRDEIVASDKNRGSEWDANRRIAMDRVRRLRGAVLRSAKIHKTRRNEESTEAISSIKATENTYMEMMRLKAPVDYWSKSATEFRSSKAKRLNVLLITGSIGGFGLVAAYICGIKWIVDNVGSPIESKIAIAALLGLLSTCYFWSLRLITKLYLSEHHLATDAGERSILIQTYLAMIHDGSASDTDRPLILASIFRSSSDGVVKDDAGIDPSVFAAFAKLLSPR